MVEAGEHIQEPLPAIVATLEENAMDLASVPTSSEPARPCTNEETFVSPPVASEPARPCAPMVDDKTRQRVKTVRRLSVRPRLRQEDPLLALEAASTLLMYRPSSPRQAAPASPSKATGQATTTCTSEKVVESEVGSGLTRAKLAMAALLNLVDCINMNILTPYAAEMVSRLVDQPLTSPEVLRKVGLLVGVYNISEMIFSPSWGRLSDRIGRRPVLLLSLGGAALVPIVFGLSNSFEMALIVRAFNGMLCGSIGITKTYVAELVSKEKEARAFSILTTCYSVGMLIGPAVGGQLQSPADWSMAMDELLDTPVLRIFKKEPFLLPNLVFSIFACTVWVLAFFFLQESLPAAKRQALREAAAQAKVQKREAAATVQDTQETGCTKFRNVVLRQLPFFTYPSHLLRAMAAYGLAVGYVIATVQNIMLLYQIPVEEQGFGLGPQTLGMLQNCAAVGLLVTQLLLYPKLVQLKGYRWCVVVGLCAVLAVTLPMPLYGLMADPDVFGPWRLAPLALMMVIQQAAFGFCTPTTTVWINRFSGGLDRGEINGWANSFAALCRALAPMLVGLLQSIGASAGGYAGRYLALYVVSLMAIAISGLLLPVLPKGPAAPKQPPVEEEEEDSENESEEGSVEVTTKDEVTTKEEVAKKTCISNAAEA